MINKDEDCISRQSAIFLASELKQDLPDDERLADMVMSHNEGILEYQTQLSLLPFIKLQEPCEDAISRQAALGCCRNEWEEEVEIRLKSLPSVNPQSKTGHWIDTGSGQMCSSCGEIQHGYDSFRRFCASCGIRMVEQQESEE